MATRLAPVREFILLVAFDMFGTLADTASVARELAPSCGDMAGGVARDMAG